MPKSEGFLIEKICDIDNLRLAFYQAKRAKATRDDVINFSKNLDVNLLNIKCDLEKGNFKFGDYKLFKIYDPKERNICAASFEERIVHHAIINICKDNFNKYQPASSFANIKGKGVFAAVEKACNYQQKYKWFLKLDIKKCFETIDHEIMYKLLCRRFKDPFLLAVFKKIIESYHFDKNRGLPLGNLTSQYLANHLVAQIDYYILQKLRIKNYVRYMDDMVLWHNDKSVLISAANEINEFTNNNLKQQLKPICLNYCERGLPFCGFVLHPAKVRLNKVSKNRFSKKYKKITNELENNTITEDAFRIKSNALLSFILHADSFAFRKKCIFAKDFCLNG